MPTPFSKVLVRLRKEAGFETAYQFFHKNGGQKVFKYSFTNYLRIENGTHLPQPDRLPLLSYLIRSPITPGQLQELVSAYLKTWLKSEELARWVKNALQDMPDKKTSLDPGTQALSKLTIEDNIQISIRQHKAILASSGSYWCYRMLASSKQPLTVQTLSKSASLSVKETESGLRILCKEGIAKRLKSGLYESQLPRKHHIFPPVQLQDSSTRGKSMKYITPMLKKRGESIAWHQSCFRVDLDKLYGFVSHLSESAKSLRAYSVSDKKDHSAFVMAEANVYKLFDF
ncbi:hypothetical protein ACFL6Y_11035 [Elusimicrobiota bacterium]